MHRIGQTSSVDIHYLVAKGTADDYLWYLPVPSSSVHKMEHAVYEADPTKHIFDRLKMLATM